FTRARQISIIECPTPPAARLLPACGQVKRSRPEPALDTLSTQSPEEDFRWLFPGVARRTGTMKLLALLHGPPHTGSDTTIRRIGAHLVGYGHSVDLGPEPAEPAELAQLAEAHGAAALIGTHAFFSGRAFLHADLPYVLVFGGTDLNELSEDTESFAVMTRAV